MWGDQDVQCPSAGPRAGLRDWCPRKRKRSHRLQESTGGSSKMRGRVGNVLETKTQRRWTFIYKLEQCKIPTPKSESVVWCMPGVIPQNEKREMEKRGQG